MEEIAFADGTVLDGAGIAAKVSDDVGSPIGAGFGPVIGSPQTDHFIHTTGDGSYTISDYGVGSFSTDRLTFTDVTVADASFEHTLTGDLEITLANGEQVTILDHFASSSWDMEEIAFADGTVLDREDIRDKTMADQKASGFVLGSQFSENYIHSTGDGSYTISDYGVGSFSTDRLTFTDVTVADASFEHTLTGDLEITLANGEQVTILDHFASSSWDMEEIAFADGTVLDREDIRDKTMADQKASGFVLGSQFSENYVHSTGDGSYTISDFASGGTKDRLTFTDVTLADVEFAQTYTGDLTVTLANGETIRVLDHFTSSSWDMEEIAFADGTVLSLQGIRNKMTTGNDSNDVIDGTRYADAMLGGGGNDVLRGHDGNDTIAGGAGFDVLIGGSGNDRFVFDANDGHRDEITDFTVNRDELDISAWGATALSDLTISQTASSATAADIDIEYNGNVLRLLDIDIGDVSSLNGDDFIFST